ncbi:MAG: hybrid sensor histidine kinase/response regulator [Anaerolineae bacterium]
MTDRVRLLVVEDDPIDQRALLRLVQRSELPYDCTIVTSVAAANAAAESSPYDLVLTDYRLQDGTGFEVIDAIEQTPVIFITGVGSEELAVRAMKAGAYDYLTKDTSQRYLELLPVVVENTIKRHRAEQQARDLAQERARGEILENFLKDISHDLRTPLTNLGTSIYLLQRYADQLVTQTMEQPENTASLQEQATRIKDRVMQISDNRTHLEQIITDMLEMVKADNLTELTRVRYDLNALTQQIVEDYTMVAVQHGQTLNFEPASEALFVQIGLQEFAMVITHLIKNAIAYTPEGGLISVGTNLEGEHATLCVRDTGIGIPPDDLPNIFRRFYRVNKARTMNKNGSGIGLALVRRLVELHEGTITVNSDPGSGSEFCVLLPRES